MGWVFDEGVDGFELSEEEREVFEEDHVGAVAWGLIWVGMCFHEDGGDARGYGCASEVWDELALTAGGVALSAWELDGVGGVKDDGGSVLCHDGEAAHIDDEVAVAEGGSAFAGEDIGIACGVGFFDDIVHVPRGEELTFFDIDGDACGGDVGDEVSLTAKEGWGLEHVDGLCGDSGLAGFVDVGDDGDVEGLADLVEGIEAFVHADTAS